MRCLLILRMQRRVELLLLRSLCILMDLAGVYGMLRFVKRLLGVFSLFRVYSAGRNRLLILVKLAGVLPLLLGSRLRTGMGVAACVCPADGRLGLLRLDDVLLCRRRAHTSLAILRLAIPTRPPLKKPAAAALPPPGFPDAGAEP